MTEASRTPSDQLANVDLRTHLKKLLISQEPPEGVIRTRVEVDEIHALIDVGGRTVWAHSSATAPMFRLVGEGWCVIADWVEEFTAIRAQEFVGDEDTCLDDLVLIRMML